MNAQQYLVLVANDVDAGEVANKVEKLDNRERKALREELLALGCNKLIKSLFYNYNTQSWVE